MKKDGWGGYSGGGNAAGSAAVLKGYSSGAGKAATTVNWRVFVTCKPLI